MDIFSRGLLSESDKFNPEHVESLKMALKYSKTTKKRILEMYDKGLSPKEIIYVINEFKEIRDLEPITWKELDAWHKWYLKNGDEGVSMLKFIKESFGNAIREGLKD